MFLFWAEVHLDSMFVVLVVGQRPPNDYICRLWDTLCTKSKVSIVYHCRSRFHDSYCGPASVQILYHIWIFVLGALNSMLLWADANANSIFVV